MDIDLRLMGETSADELRSLRAWLVEDDELRGCVHTVERPPTPDSLGPVLDALKIVADPAAGVLAAALVAWVKSRAGAVKLVLQPQRGGRVELDARQIRRLDAGELSELAERVTRLVSGELRGTVSGEQSASCAPAGEDTDGQAQTAVGDLGST